MKKYISLLFFALLAAVAVNAQKLAEPLVGSNFIVTSISPNGKYAAAANPYFYTVYLVNLETLDITEFAPATENDRFDLGSEQCVSDDGVMLVSTTYEGTATYIENGAFKQLTVPAGVTSAFSKAITPDGSRIVGTVGRTMSFEDRIMQRPVLWNRLPDGTYSDPVELPYPSTDFTGRTPQYVLVGGISEDGKTIACELHDFYGTTEQPLVIREDENGNWSYELIAENLVNPKGIEFPKYTNEPEPEDYMSVAEKAAYNKALQDASNAVEPNPTDYMTEAEKAAYLEAVASGEGAFEYEYMTTEEYAAYSAAVDDYYKKAYPNAADFLSASEYALYSSDAQIWATMFYEFSALYEEALRDAVRFEMNHFTLSPNGRYYAVAGNKKGRTDCYIIDLGDGNKVIKKSVKSENVVAPSFVSSDGRILATKTATVDDPFNVTYYAPSIDADFIPLHEYVKEANPELYPFMEENMFHKITESYWDDDLEEDVEYTKEIWVTGTPCCNADMSVIATWAMNSWDYDDSAPYMFSYILPMDYKKSDTGIKDVKEPFAVAMDKDGVIRLSGNATLVAIYDMNGRMVFSEQNPSSVINAGLGKGAYIIKVTNGTSSTVVKVLR